MGRIRVQSISGELDHNHLGVRDDSAIHDVLLANLLAKDQIWQLPQEHRQNRWADNGMKVEAKAK